MVPSAWKKANTVLIVVVMIPLFAVTQGNKIDAFPRSRLALADSRFLFFHAPLCQSQNYSFNFLMSLFLWYQYCTWMRWQPKKGFSTNSLCPWSTFLLYQHSILWKFCNPSWDPVTHLVNHIRNLWFFSNLCSGHICLTAKMQAWKPFHWSLGQQSLWVDHSAWEEEVLSDKLVC